MLYYVKAGVMGLDELGSQYAELIKDHVKNLSLLAASGRTQKELLFAKNNLSLEYVYGDEKQLIESHDIDALFIYSETHLRANLAIQAIEAGKHVFLINPIALNLDDAQTIHKIADSHPSQTVMCSSAVKSYPILQKLKEIVSSGQLGDIQFVQIDSGFIQSINMKNAKASGSSFLDGLLDEIELCQWLTEEKIESVKVIKKDGLKICQAFGESGLSVQYMLRSKLQTNNGTIELYGNKAKLVLDNKAQKHIDVHYNDGEWKRFEIDEKSTFFHAEYVQLHHFTRCIMGKEKNRLKLDTAVNSMRLALAFEKADVLASTVTIEDS